MGGVNLRKRKCPSHDIFGTAGCPLPNPPILLDIDVSHRGFTWICLCPSSPVFLFASPTRLPGYACALHLTFLELCRLPNPPHTYSWTLVCLTTALPGYASAHHHPAFLFAPPMALPGYASAHCHPAFFLNLPHPRHYLDMPLPIITWLFP